VAEEEAAATLRTLSERPEDLVQKRTRALNRLYHLLRNLLVYTLNDASTKIGDK
jgi:hypothetical protein